MTTLVTIFTHGAEYHLVDGICRAVRNRKNGEWYDIHPALNKPLQMASTLNAGAHSPKMRVRPTFGGTSWIEPHPVQMTLVTHRRAAN